jgi:hypothetical protein
MQMVSNRHNNLHNCLKLTKFQVQMATNLLNLKVWNLTFPFFLVLLFVLFIWSALFLLSTSTIHVKNSGVHGVCVCVCVSLKLSYLNSKLWFLLYLLTYTTCLSLLQTFHVPTNWEKKCLGWRENHPWHVKFKTFAKEKDDDDLSRHINQLQIEALALPKGDESILNYFGYP